MTVSAPNIATSRTVQFTAAEIISMAWKLARMLDVSQEPTAAEAEHARKWIMLKMDSLQARARIARSVILDEVTLAASTASYALDDDVWDVVGDAQLIDDNGTEVSVKMVGRDYYQGISDKTIEGVPTTYYVEKLSGITLKLWPVPSEVWTLRIQAVKWLRTTASTANTVDLERHFQEYLVVALAYEIARGAGIDPIHVATLRADAKELLNMSIGAAKQRGPVQLRVRHRTGWLR